MRSWEAGKFGSRRGFLPAGRQGQIACVKGRKKQRIEIREQG